MRIDAIAPEDLHEIEALLDRAFGRGRHTRTAARLRAGSEMLPDLSFVARAPGGALLGSVQCWPVVIVDRSRRARLTLLGPLAVDPSAQGGGIGTALMERATAAAGTTPMILIGDEPYYGRFGFSAAVTGGWSLPGPFERHRLLARNGVGLPWRGAIRPAEPQVRAA